jgi:hypothetical protein
MLSPSGSRQLATRRSSIGRFVAEADGAACLRPEGWHRTAAAAEVVSSQTVVQSSPVSSVLPPVASGGFRRRRVVARHRRGRPDGASRAVLPAISLGTVRRPSRPGTHLRRFARSRRGDKIDVYRSAELNKGGKISGVKITLDIGIVFSLLPARCVCDSWLWPTEVKFGAANGSGFSVRGRAVVKFSVGAMKLCRFVGFGFV